VNKEQRLRDGFAFASNTDPAEPEGPPYPHGVWRGTDDSDDTGSPEYNAEGLYRHGPQRARAWSWLQLIEMANSEEQQNAALLAALEAEARQTRRRERRAEKRTLRRRAELEAAMACRRAIMTGVAA
jgi:hypothetical protein